MDLRFIIAGATGWLLVACCGTGRDHQAVEGPAGSPPYFIVRAVTDGSVQAYGATEDPMLLMSPLPPGDYVVTVATRQTSGTATINWPSSTVAIPTGSRCTPLEVSFTGDQTVGRPAYVFRSDDDLSGYGAVIGGDGRIVMCLPAGPYFLSLDEDVSALSEAVEIGDRPVSRTISAFSNARIDRVPETPVRIPSLSQFRIEDIPEDVVIVGVGEPDHGGADYLRVRSEMLLAGAKKARIDRLALEAGTVEVFPLDDYVAGDPVDIRAAVEALGYWMWDTEDFLQVLDQIRTHNASAAPTKIRIFGVDVQHTAAAVEFLSRHATPLGLSSQQVDLIAVLQRDRGAGYKAETVVRRRALRALLSTISAAHPDPAVDRSIRARAALSARALLARCDIQEATGMLRYAARETGMADMTSALVSSSGAGVAYWAHNGHVARAYGDSIASAGLVLDRRWKAKYYVLGVFAHAGVTRAWDAASAKGVDPVAMPPLPPHHFESVMLAASGAKDRLVVDLRRLPAELKNWLVVPRRARDFGASYPGDAGPWRLFPFGRAFDAAVVIRFARPTVPTLTGIRRAGGGLNAECEPVPEHMEQDMEQDPEQPS